LEYYESIGNEYPATVLKRVRCLLNLERAAEAMDLLDTIPESRDLEYQETLLACFKAARSNSQRIPSLAHRVMDLRVAATLDREMLSKYGPSRSPISHGSLERGLNE
jgi:hypothetical protein